MIRSETKTGATAAAVKRQRERQPQSPLAMGLLELYQLLEGYAPVWYTAKLHNKTAAALEHPENLSPELYICLFDLLESYAPPWYTEAQQARATALRRSLPRV